MNQHFAINPKLDIVLERFIDAPRRLVWEALTKPEHLREWYMPKPWGVVSNCEMDVRPGGIFRVDITTGNGQLVPNLGCFLDVVPLERLVWTSMLFPGYRPAVFDDIPITALMTMETVGCSGIRNRILGYSGRFLNPCCSSPHNCSSGGTGSPLRNRSNQY